MPTPVEAYREGYEKGKNDTIGGRAAEVTMGMLRDDPGGHFAAGYRDGAAGNAFNPPPTPVLGQPKSKGLIPKFSENPLGWFLGVMIVVELWALWQLLKAPFQLIGALIRSEKPSLLVIVKNVIIAGLAVTAVWSVHNVNEIRGTTSYTQSVPASPADAQSLKDVKWLRTSPLLSSFGPADQFGISPSLFFARRPDTVARFQTVAPGFDTKAFGDSLGIFVASLPDGAQYFAMAGCPEHMCGATRSAAAVESVSGEVFLLTVSIDVASSGSRQRNFFGRNDSFVRNLLIYLEENEGRLFDQLKSASAR